MVNELHGPITESPQFSVHDVLPRLTTIGSVVVICPCIVIEDMKRRKLRLQSRQRARGSRILDLVKDLPEHLAVMDQSREAPVQRTLHERTKALSDT